MLSSSKWDSNKGAGNGRLHFQKKVNRGGAWSALRNNRYQWIGVDFKKVVKVTMFATQGRPDAAQWVKSYKLQYSLDGYEFQVYSIKGKQKVGILSDTNKQINKQTPSTCRLYPMTAHIVLLCNVLLTYLLVEWCIR